MSNFTYKFSTPFWNTPPFNKDNSKIRKEETLRLYYINQVREPMQRDEEILKKKNPSTISDWIKLNLLGKK